PWLHLGPCCRPLSTHSMHLALSPASPGPATRLLPCAWPCHLSTFCTFCNSHPSPGPATGLLAAPQTHGFTHLSASALGCKNTSSSHSSTASSPGSIWSSTTHLTVYLASFSLCRPGWSAVAGSQLTASSASWVHAILLPQPPE
uniref:Uncharacterized protein n=1 Tax=Theropithecus gelada TaxID=9565 RepID=A0A8D2FR57_THEGE